MTETQDQLVRSIEQELENLMHFSDELSYDYECNLYYECDEDGEPIPVIEKFTPELLKELQDLVYSLDNEPIEIDD